MTGARPLDPGQHEFGATLGGGLVEFGGSPIPLPNIVVQGRSGVARPLDRPLDVSYGIDATGLAFGVLPLQVGADWLLVDQSGPLPAVALTNNVWFTTNVPGLAYKPDPRLDAWGADQVEVDASWLFGQQLLYVGVAQYFDFQDPELTLTPVVGARFDPSPKAPGGLQLHAEARWYGVNQTKELDTVRWASAPRGVVGATLGVSWILGGEK